MNEKQSNESFSCQYFLHSSKMSAKKFQHCFRGAQMNAERMTQKAMEASHVEAIKKGHPELTTLHLLEALLKQEHGLVDNLLQKMGTDSAVLEERVTDELGRLSTFNGASGRVTASGEMNQALMHVKHALSQFNALGYLPNI